MVQDVTNVFECNQTKYTQMEEGKYSCIELRKDLSNYFFYCIESYDGDRTLTEDFAIINILEKSIEDSIHRCQSPEMEAVHRPSPSTVDLCTPDEESQDEMMVDSPVHLSPK